MARSPHLKLVKDSGTFNSAGSGSKLFALECGHSIGVGNNCFRSRVVCWKCKQNAGAMAALKGISNFMKRSI